MTPVKNTLEQQGLVDKARTCIEDKYETERIGIEKFVLCKNGKVFGENSDLKPDHRSPRFLTRARRGVENSQRLSTNSPIRFITSRTTHTYSWP